VKNPYAGRRPKPPQAKQGGQLLRQSKGGGPSLKGSYDVQDPYLRGRAGGESHPYYLKTGGKAKR
jgi:hypothetical protein